MPDTLVAFGISGGLATGMRKLFTSHPPLDERIRRLRNAA
jgi:heat shock protein HtpX